MSRMIKRMRSFPSRVSDSSVRAVRIPIDAPATASRVKSRETASSSTESQTLFWNRANSFSLHFPS